MNSPETTNNPTIETGDNNEVITHPSTVPLIRMACDNCTFTTDAKGKPIIVCTGHCVNPQPPETVFYPKTPRQP